jgi:hydrogenase nickel incorporation protein HypB
MCTICGCSTAVLAAHPDREPPAHDHAHTHDHDHAHAHPHGTIDFGNGPAGVHIPGLGQERTIRIERDILSKNDAFAATNRARLRNVGVFALNFVSSPGSGKTSLLVRMIGDLKQRWPIAVVEGDQQTSRDADRIRATGAPAVQVNTGKGCHLDAHMVGHALDHLPLAPGGLLFIENVGNLVCPAAFDLGEAHKVVVLSVTEGEDKPLKYPGMFAAADLMLLNKSDLLPHLEFDVGACIASALSVNPRIRILTVSARTGDGLAAFYAWIEGRAAAITGQAAAVG